MYVNKLKYVAYVRHLLMHAINVILYAYMRCMCGYMLT